MLLTVAVDLIYTAQCPCDALLQIEACDDAGQSCSKNTLSIAAGDTMQQLTGEDGIGLRRWINVQDRLACHYEVQVDVQRAPVDLCALHETPRYQLPACVLPYLLPSRNCQSDLFLDFTAAQFGDLTGGALVAAARDWVYHNFTYDIFATYMGTTATDSFASLRGVCRDYAHVLIALVRAAGLPARFVSVYAPDVNPQDFHAVVEVFLDGEWHLIDPTGMADAPQIVRICVGRDAADTSLLTSYGFLALETQSVRVQHVTA